MINYMSEGGNPYTLARIIRYGCVLNTLELSLNEDRQATVGAWYRKRYHQFQAPIR